MLLPIEFFEYFEILEKDNFLCQQCQQPFLEEDIVVLNGTAEDLDLMRTKLEARQARFKAEKKARNHAKRNGKADATETSSSSQDSTTKSSVLANRSHDPKEETKPVANGEEGRQKSKSQNGKSDPKLLLKRGNKLSGMLMASNLITFMY